MRSSSCVRAHSGRGKDAGRNVPRLLLPLTSIEPMAFGGWWPGCMACAAESGRAGEGEGVCLLVVASAVLTRGLHGAGCTGCHGNCCAWSGVTSRAAGTGPAAPPGVLLALTQQHECGLAPHAWDLDREAEGACLFPVSPYVLSSGDNTRTTTEMKRNGKH